MSAVDRESSILGRIAGGGFAGAVFGLIGEVVLILMFLDRPTPEDRWMLLIGPIIGAVVVGLLAAFFGHWQLSPGARIVAIATLSGVVAGAIAGWAVFPMVMVVINPNDTEGKAIAAYQF